MEGMSAVGAAYGGLGMGKIGKMDFVRSVAGKIAREAGHFGAQATEAKARAEPIAAPMTAMVPFEKRVLMDAVLEWDIGGLEQTTTFLSGLHNLISAQVEGYSDFLDDFNTLAEGALTTVEVLGALNESNDNDNQDQLAEMIERMGAALTQLKDGSLTALSSIFTPEGEAPIDFDGEIADLLETALIGFADNEGAFAGMTAAERTTAEGTIRTAVTDARVAATFNLAAFTSNTVTEKVEALSVTLAAALTDLGLVAEDIAGKITEVGDDYFNGLLGDGLAVNLADITVTVGGAEINLVTFTQGADNATVEVAVHLPSFAFDLDSLLDMANAGISLPISLTDDSSADSLTFTLSSIIEKTGAVVDAVGLDITDFNFAPLFELGGPIDMTGIDASVNLGLLTAEITDIAVAQIRATITVDPDLNLGGQFN